MDFSRSILEGPPAEMQYFSDANLGGKSFRADFCPTNTDKLAACTENFRGGKMWDGIPLPTML